MKNVVCTLHEAVRRAVQKLRASRQVHVTGFEPPMLFAYGPPEAGL